MTPSLSTKLSHKRKSLPRSAVIFAEQLMEAGIYPGFFESIVYERPQSKLEIALITAFMDRIHNHDHKYYFRPIALNWKIEAEEAQWMGKMCHLSYRVSFPGYMNNTTQLQPALKETSVSILETKQLMKGVELLIELFGHSINEREVDTFLKDRHSGLGLAHWEKIADMVSVGPCQALNQVTPVEGEKSVGRSVFYLLQYTDFKDFNDRIGKEHIVWLEVQFVGIRQNRVKEHLLLSVYTDLNCVIPQNSLVVVSGLNWIKKPGPSDY